MSDEQDSWFQSAFGLNIGGVADRIRSEAEEAAGKVQSAVQSVKTAVGGVLDDVVETVTDVARKVAGAAGAGGGGSGGGGGGAGGGSPKTAGPAGGGTGSFPLSGSVGRGGRNAPGDVKAVQQALGIGVDGDCGSKTIAAIEAYQRNMGQSKPDGRVDAGGATERALASGKRAPQAVSDGDSGGLLDRLQAGVASILESGALVNQVAPAPVAPPPPVPIPVPPTPVPIAPVAEPVAGLAEEGAGILLDEVAAEVAAATAEAAPEIAAGAAVGGVAAAGIIIAGVAVGAATPIILGHLVEHGEEIDQQTDPDERKLPGGLPDEPANDPLDGGAPAIAPGLPETPANDPGSRDPAEAPSAGQDDPAVLAEFEQAISDHTKRVTSLEAEVDQLETSLKNELATVANDESMLNALEEQKRRGTFDPKIGAFEAQVRKDFDETRLAGTSAKDVDRLQAKVNALSDENLAIQTKLELESDVNRTMSTLKASDFQNALLTQSRRISAMTTRLDFAKDGVIDLEVRNGKIGERLKRL